MAVTSILLICFLAGWFVNGWRWEAKAYAAEQQLIKKSQEQQKLAESYEELRQKKDKVQNEIVKQVYIETSKPAYDCRIPESGMLLIHKAVETANSGKFNK